MGFSLLYLLPKIQRVFKMLPNTHIGWRPCIKKWMPFTEIILGRWFRDLNVRMLSVVVGYSALNIMLMVQLKDTKLVSLLRDSVKSRGTITLTLSVRLSKPPLFELCSLWLLLTTRNFTNLMSIMLSLMANWMSSYIWSNHGAFQMLYFLITFVVLTKLSMGLNRLRGPSMLGMYVKM